MGLGVERYLTGQAEAETEQNRSACRVLRGLLNVLGRSKPLVLITWDLGPFVLLGAYGTRFSTKDCV